MNDLDRSISDYVSIIRSMKPLCLGCLDLDPSIFDQRAISWNFSYPNLDPRKVVGGVDSGCMSCALIYAAFQSIGLDLRTSHDVQEIHVYNKGEGKNLMVTAEYLKEPTIQIELYTIQGEIPYVYYHHCPTHHTFTYRANKTFIRITNLAFPSV